MSKEAVHIQEPSEEMKQKIIRARLAISTQKQRFLLCPYCKHKALRVFDDTRGHVEAKCTKCGLCIDECSYDAIKKVPLTEEKI